MDSQNTHHGEADIFRHVLRHIDQPALSRGDQDEAVQRLQKSLVWQAGVRSVRHLEP